MSEQKIFYNSEIFIQKYFFMIILFINPQYSLFSKTFVGVLCINVHILYIVRSPNMNVCTQKLIAIVCLSPVHPNSPHSLGYGKKYVIENSSVAMVCECDELCAPAPYIH